MTIDVIIPVYHPGKELFALLDALEKQSVPVQNILLMNTEKSYFDALTKGVDMGAKYPNVKVFHLTKQEFDHGGTRRRGVELSHADVFVMMTQDAVPADKYLLQRLTCNLQGDIAAAYARQLPKKHSGVEERFSRQFNYPDKRRVKSAEDLPGLGIKTFFCSNVCAAYRREIYEELGGFVKHTIFNEDMIYAAHAVEAGYSVAYAADAKIIHSHNYSNGQQFHRNFDLGVSQADHPEIFAAYPSESEGKRMVKDVTAYLRSNHMSAGLPHFYMQCACKYAGYLLGKNYRRLPKKWVLAFTSNKEYWKQNRKEV